MTTQNRTAKGKQGAKTKPATSEARSLQVDGGHAAFAVKLRAFLEAEDRAHRAAQRRAWTWIAGILGIAVTAAAAFFRFMDSDWGFVPAIVFVLSVFAGIAALVQALSGHDELERGRLLQAEAGFYAIANVSSPSPAPAAHMLKARVAAGRKWGTVGLAMAIATKGPPADPPPQPCGQPRPRGARRKY